MPEMIASEPLSQVHTNSNTAAALFGKTRRAVLGLLFCHSDHSYYLNEIVRLSGTGVGAVQRELSRMERAGLVLRRRRGNLVLYHANTESPLFPALRELMMRTSGVADVLAEALAPLAHCIRVAFIYGSMAKGQERAGSDVDVMVIGDVSFGEVVGALCPTQEKLGREVNPSVFPPDELRERTAAGRSFIRNVLIEPKVFLIGDQGELGRLAAERLAAST